MQMILIDAVGKALVKYGHMHIGVNNVAEEAGVEATSIYRQFKDFDDLLRTYAEKRDFWLNSLKEYGDTEILDRRGFVKHILSGEFSQLFKNKELQQLLIWELGDMDDIVAPIAIKREVMADKLLVQSEDVMKEHGINFNYIMSILIAGIYYIVLHKDKSTFCQVDINKKEDRDEFIRTVDWLTDQLFDISENTKAIKALKVGVSVDDVAKIFDLPIHKVEQLASQVVS